MGEFVLKTDMIPKGDQPRAIEQLTEGLRNGERMQTLLGVTGSGKTFTMANVIAQLQRPTLVLAHNKTLAAQLCSEFKEFFPDNAVEFFVSYYDYYQPEAYIPSTDTFIEKETQTNEEIERLRLSATSSLHERRDVIVIASVSCIYGLGDPVEYLNMSVSLRPGMRQDRDDVIRALVDVQYERNELDFHRGTFRAHGDVLEIYPSYFLDRAIRVEFFGDEIDRITEFDVVTGKAINRLNHIAIFPASHYVASKDTIERALGQIEQDMAIRVKEFQEDNKLIEAQRIEQRTRYDMEMMREIGYCSGIENYSRYLDGRSPGEPPFTLLDYFPEDFIIFVDESHVTLPQVRGMFAGDYSRKSMLINFGFRLPAAFDNRPLKYDEFMDRVGQIVCVSATPADYEKEHSGQIVEQIIRPTGLLDPEISVRPIQGQIDDLIGEIRQTTERGNRTLITTLTKRMSEMLTDYLKEMDIRVRYLHSEIHTVERMEIIRDLRLGEFDVLVGINLLREGLDLPEVELIAILDADKEGFLRSDRSLIQTIGRAARNDKGRVIMYADTMTDSMTRAIDETSRRRKVQMEFNQAHDIVPHTIKKSVRDILEITKPIVVSETADPETEKKAVQREIGSLEQKMLEAAAKLDFETAAILRDRIKLLRSTLS